MKILFYLLFTIYFLLSAKDLAAETMSNTNYILHLGTFNSVSGSVSNTNYKLNFTGGQTSPGLYTGTNYKVKAGFQNVRPSNIPFSFSISQSLIDFGILSATNPVTRTNATTPHRIRELCSTPAGGPAGPHVPWS